MPDFGKALRWLRPGADNDQRPLFPPLSATPDLARQLHYLKARSGNASMEPRLSHADILPEGSDEITPYGRHYVVRKVYDHEYSHGKVRLSRFSISDLERLMMLMRERGTAPHRDAIIFLDTETTGMQGGAGMCPFLIGLGYFVDDDFHMLQYFIRDFDEEPSMLYALDRLLKQFRLVVTYNGGSFDIPLLESRFTLARLDNPFKGMPHLDLLTSARRLWRSGHGSCRLVALERELVAFLRGPDVPGAMIPRAYFDFLQRRPGSILRGVFTHNVYDVVSLAALTVCACDRVTAPPVPLDEPLDLYSLARVLENTPEWTRAIELYGMALNGGLPDAARVRAEESLAVMYRRAGDHERALAVCRSLIAESTFSITGYEGAAIYYERIARDPGRALEVVDEALERLEPAAETKRWRALLQARRERLRQKTLQF